MAAEEQAAVAVVPQPTEQEDEAGLQDLALEIEKRQEAIRKLDAACSRKDTEVRRAREEADLLRELHTINQMTRRKLDTDVERPNKMKISQENLDAIMRLENAIKQESKKTLDLNNQAQLVARLMETSDEAVAKHRAHIDLVKDITGWERYQFAARGYTNPQNTFEAHQKILADIQAEQETLKQESAKYTKRIEELSVEIEKRKTLDEQIVQAKAMLAQRIKDEELVEEDLRSLKRIAFRKERMLQESTGSDADTKAVKQLEGDKRVLHTELLKACEYTRANEKSIVAQDLKLRTLEARLAAINAFLATVLVNPDGSQAREDVAVEKFVEVQGQLHGERLQLSERDKQLEQLDSYIEQLEKKQNILQAAAYSRATTLEQEEQDKHRDDANINERIGAIEDDFLREKDRLSNEQQRLQRTLERLQGLPRATA